MMDFVFALLVALAFVMVIGHGMWLAVAWILRGGRPKQHRTAFDPTVAADRTATARYLNRLHSHKIIDSRTHDRLMQAIAEDLDPSHSLLQHFDKKESADQAVASTSDTQATETPPDRPPERTSEQSVPPTAADTPKHGALDEVSSVEVIAQSQTPPEPRRPLNEILVSFMAEKNIRWGELIGGLLILCCSTALVISLWSQIESIPILKFVIFTTVTAALFGAGLFVRHRWDLPTTGRAVLTISTMLVPLNFLAFAAFSEGGSTGGGWTSAIEITSVVLFGWLTLLAGRVIMPNTPKLFAAGVVGISSTALAMRFVSPQTSIALLGTALVPVVLYVIVMAVSLWHYIRQRVLGDEDAKRIILQLGVQTLSCIAPFGLVLYASGNFQETFRLFAPLVSTLATPALIIGLFLWHKLASAESNSVRTSAASIALVSSAVMLIAVGLAWPAPSRLLPTVLVNALAMVGLSRVSKHASVHAIAIAWFALAWVLLAHLVNGSIIWTATETNVLISALLSTMTGKALIGAAAAGFILAEWFTHRRRPELSRSYWISTAVITSISVALVSFRGFGLPGDGEHVTWVYLVYAVGAFAATWRTQRVFATWYGTVLLQLAAVQALVYTWPSEQLAWPTAFLTCATGLAVGAMVLRRRSAKPVWVKLYSDPWTTFAAGVSLVAALWMIVSFSADSLSALSLRMLWLSALWMVMAAARRSSIMFAGGQVALLVAASSAVHKSLLNLAWYAEASPHWKEPWVWQAHFIVAAALGLLWALTRTFVDWKRSSNVTTESAAETSANAKGLVPVLHELLDPIFPAADKLFAAGALIGCVVLSLWGVAPSLGAEHYGWSDMPASMGEHTHAAGIGSWALLAILVITFLVYLIRKLDQVVVFGVMVAVACATSLLAARFEEGGSVGSAWRWLLASTLMIYAIAAWAMKLWNEKTFRLATRFPKIDISAIMSMRRPMIFLFGVPALLLTATFTLSVGQGNALLPATISNMGLRLLLLGPAVLITISLIGLGMSCPHPAYASVAAALASSAIIGAELGVLGHSGRWISLVTVVWLVQLNALVSAVLALLWQQIGKWHFAESAPSQYPTWPLLVGRLTIGIVLMLAACAVYVDASSVSSAAGEAGTIWGFMAFFLIELSLFKLAGARIPFALPINQWALFGAVLVALALAPFDTGNWVCFHALALGFVGAGWIQFYTNGRRTHRLLESGWSETFHTVAAKSTGLDRSIEHDLACVSCDYNLRGLVGSSRCPECGTTIRDSIEQVVKRLTPDWAAELTKVRSITARAVLLCVALSAAFAIRAVWGDPQRPWWSLLVLAGTAALSMTLGAWAPRRSFAYLGGIASCLAASMWFRIQCWDATALSFIENLCNIVNVIVVALVASGAVWLWIERTHLRHRLSDASSGRLPVFHRSAAVVATIVVAASAGSVLISAAANEPLRGIALISWIALASTAAFVIACARDTLVRHVPSLLYILGLCALAHTFSQVGWEPPTIIFALSLGFASYALLSAIVRKYWTHFTRTSTVVVVDTFIPSGNVVLTAMSLLLGSYTSITHPLFTIRILVCVGPLVSACAMMLWRADGKWHHLRTYSLALLSFGGLLFAWSWISPDTPALFLHRVAGVVESFAILALMAGVVVSRTGTADAWRAATGRCTAGIGVLAGIAVLCVSGVESYALLNGAVPPLTEPAVIALVVSYSLMIISCGLFAVRDRFDPLSVRTSAKGSYIYAAELLAGILALHIRATMPWLFHGLITQYWPILVMGLAVSGVAVGEACYRRNLAVIGRPLKRTGTLLPILAFFEIFIQASRVHYSIVLLTAGAIYAVLAAMRRSFLLGMLAAFALNGSLWYLLHHTPGLGLAEHPQLWCVPLALAVLAASHLNRGHLSEQQRTSIHYGCLLAIYLSSTADIFLIGVAKAPWLPLVLAGLSITGIFVGLARHIRSCLFLGTGFLCLSLLTMIWHAAANLGWTWAWYIAGIALGVGIITVFALFEKKRNEMTSLMDHLKEWSG